MITVVRANETETVVRANETETVVRANKTVAQAYVSCFGLKKRGPSHRDWKDNKLRIREDA